MVTVQCDTGQNAHRDVCWQHNKLLDALCCAAATPGPGRLQLLLQGGLYGVQWASWLALLGKGAGYVFCFANLAGAAPVHL